MSAFDVRAWIERDFCAAEERKKKKQDCASQKRRGPCALCGVENMLTRHHLVPVSLRLSGRRTAGPVVKVCRPCHDGIHRRFAIDQLAADGDTLEKLITLWRGR